MVFELDPDYLDFPNPALADQDGLLAIGGDLRRERLLRAYSLGIFPWYSEETPIMWYAPKERFVLPCQHIKISNSMHQIIRSDRFRYTYNQDFQHVIRQCSTVNRKEQDGTWIIDDMIEAFTDLHRQGYAHSIEVWNKENRLVGGLYGVAIGNVFSGESMFSKEANSSKFALIKLATDFGISLIDCQVYSDHLSSMGAAMISQQDYNTILKQQQYQPYGFQTIF